MKTEIKNDCKKIIKQIDIEGFEINCKGMLFNVNIKVDDGPIRWKNYIYLDDILPGREISNYDNLELVKSKTAQCVYIKTYTEK